MWEERERERSKKSKEERKGKTIGRQENKEWSSKEIKELCIVRRD